MLPLESQPDDDLGFTTKVCRLISGAVAVHRPRWVRIYKIDNWFDHKWMRFSGKVMGALGIWNKRLTPPPFVANRVVRVWRFQAYEHEPGYRTMSPGRDIHHHGPAAANLHRHLADMVPTTALFWFSGNTLATGQGSLMGYVPVEGEHWTFFLAFRRYYAWRVIKRKNIHDYELSRFRERADVEA